MMRRGMGPDHVIARCRPDAAYPVFAIGVKEAGVTVASQQRRAIHLVDALRQAGMIAAGSRIAIIGGGPAGLTAAAWAARASVRSTVIERDGELLATLRGNHTRLVHPNLYSWPEPGWRDPDAALPVLSWTAAPAGAVARTIESDRRPGTDRRLRWHRLSPAGEDALAGLTSADGAPRPAPASASAPVLVPAPAPPVAVQPPHPSPIRPLRRQGAAASTPVVGPAPVVPKGKQGPRAGGPPVGNTADD